MILFLVGLVILSIGTAVLRYIIKNDLRDMLFVIDHSDNWIVKMCYDIEENEDTIKVNSWLFLGIKVIDLVVVASWVLIAVGVLTGIYGISHHVFGIRSIFIGMLGISCYFGIGDLFYRGFITNQIKGISRWIYIIGILLIMIFSAIKLMAADIKRNDYSIINSEIQQYKDLVDSLGVENELLREEIDSLDASIYEAGYVADSLKALRLKTDKEYDEAIDYLRKFIDNQK